MNRILNKQKRKKNKYIFTEIYFHRNPIFAFDQDFLYQNPFEKCRKWRVFGKVMGVKGKGIDDLSLRFLFLDDSN